ncbi:threonine ammonia-lyase, biosynthetic [Desulfotalea psychrophila]|uniref:L-threonine dehydratase n=1 Tax=Desulfotalea psychrophila (strain LSv54 / DSM 12343) TaxID=177439 RepID=Q3V7H9_DESPS|nr:threonine ammonia-lyase, biosynthetic [Desulfotalea psychrophila]CAG35618.1 probable threonine dehydratase, biosynthetic [Desulfotalea psychrophila LSv54]
MKKIIRDILTSRVYEAAVETPLEQAVQLSHQLGNKILLKREDQQPVFSFKIRGAYNKIAHLSEEERARGVITASAGNHAQGVAYSAKKLGISALIVMPTTTPKIKVDAVRRMGGQVILHGDNYSEAATHTEQIMAETGRYYIPPFDDELVIAGQGTIADEILRQNPGKIDAIFIPVGGGGLIAGIAAYMKNLRPEIRIIGVEPTDSNAMHCSLKAGKRVELSTVGIFADGVAVRKVGEQTFALCQEYVDEIIEISSDELCSGIKAIYQATRSIVEPAGGLGMAGLLKYIRETGCKDKTLIAINSGANMNFERLRYVAERTLIGEEQEALFAVTMPEEAGSLKTFCQRIVEKRNITEFNYRHISPEKAHIFVGISIEQAKERQEFSQQLTAAGYENIDLTDNDLAKNHIRYMVGGKPASVQEERLFRFWFPETPGALVRFLDATRGALSISLFHYRMQGGNYSRVLVGFNSCRDDDELLERLDILGYRFKEETDNPAYKMFL